MIKTVDYKVNLYLNDLFIGDVRDLAENLSWAKRRTANGVDQIDFTINDKLFNEWCLVRGTSLPNLLKPLALSVKVIRGSEPVVAGFLATLPAYKPNGTSADLDMKFDGWINLLSGVYIRPTPTRSAKAGDMVSGWIQMAEERSRNAGKAFGLRAGEIDDMAVITRTFDGFKSVKEAITDLCDNVEGAGPFDVIFNTEKVYDIKKNIGREIKSWHIDYPTIQNGKSAVSISASEVQGFGSHVIEVGAGETSADATKNTAITSEATNGDAILEYGYREVIEQNSSISTQIVLDQHAKTKLANVSGGKWSPQITLIGRQVAPSPSVDGGLWIGDSIEILNAIDITGQTNGRFRVNELEVKVSATDSELITPKLERI